MVNESCMAREKEDVFSRLHENAGLVSDEENAELTAALEVLTEDDLQIVRREVVTFKFK